MEWHGDPSIFLQLAGQEGGVHGIMLRGQLLVELVHMLPYPPMFKAWVSHVPHPILPSREGTVALQPWLCLVQLCLVQYTMSYAR